MTFLNHDGRLPQSSSNAGSRISVEDVVGSNSGKADFGTLRCDENSESFMQFFCIVCESWSNEAATAALKLESSILLLERYSLNFMFAFTVNQN